MMHLDSSAFKSLFPKNHIPVILINIFRAGETLQKKTANEHEDRITRRLCYKLIKIQIFRDGPLSIHSQQELISPDPEKDTPEGRIDILISCDRGTEVYFAIEAKRLRVKSKDGKMRAGNDKYVNDGMMRFIIGQYAPYMRSGAMLGYVFDGDTDAARSGVSKYIKRKQTDLKLLKPEKLIVSKISTQAPIDETRHSLSDRIFVIYHLFIPV